MKRGGCWQVEKLRSQRWSKFRDQTYGSLSKMFVIISLLIKLLFKKYIVSPDAGLGSRVTELKSQKV